MAAEDETIRARFEQERAAALSRRAARTAATGPGGGHQSVSSPDTTSSDPSAGPEGAGGPAEFEKSVSDDAAQAAETKSAPRLDAYWGSFGDPAIRAALRAGAVDFGAETIHGSDDRIQMTATNTYPWSAIASLNLRSADGGDFIGTAWFVSPRVLLTAGHCLYMHDRGGWVSQVEVIPGRNGANPPPFGSVVVAGAYRSVSGWTVDRNTNYDYGVILLPETSRLGDQVGWFGYEARDDAGLQGTVVNIAGYPGDKDGGTTLWFHSNAVTNVHDQTFEYQLDTWGGQSGAPVYLYIEGRGRYGVGIHTSGSVAGNWATRITNEVMTNVNNWKALAP